MNNFMAGFEQMAHLAHQNRIPSMDAVVLKPLSVYIQAYLRKGEAWNEV